MNKKEIGERGEKIACGHLLKKGYKIIKRNYRYERGEIDIIASDFDTIIFVEVKTRSSVAFGEPEYSIDERKQGQIRKVAEAFIQENEFEDKNFRFDAVCIIFSSGKVKSINHLENAF